MSGRQDEDDDYEAGKDSDAEFEQMLAEAEEVSKNDDDVDTPRRKAKTKIGNKKKKKTRKPGRDEEGYETDHQDFCEVRARNRSCGTRSPAMTAHEGYKGPGYCSRSRRLSYSLTRALVTSLEECLIDLARYSRRHGRLSRVRRLTHRVSAPPGVSAGWRDHPLRHLSQGLPSGVSGARAGGAARGQVDVPHVREGWSAREAGQTVRRRAPGVLPVRRRSGREGRGGRPTLPGRGRRLLQAMVISAQPVTVYRSVFSPYGS